MPMFLVALALFVCLPSALAGYYYGFIASDVYVTEASFVIRGQESSRGSGVLGAVLGNVGMGPADDEAQNVANFIMSPDAVDSLESRIGLRDLYRPQGADVIARLESDASAEDLFEYYESMTRVAFDTSSGIVTLTVKSFRAEDSYAIAQEILSISEALINRMNVRAQDDLLQLARKEVDRAENRLLDIQGQLTQFRLQNDVLDPGESSSAVFNVIAGLESEKAAVQAQIAELQQYLRPDAVQIASLRTRLVALDAQIQSEQSRLTGQDTETAVMLEDYDRLLLERELASQGYASALSSLEAARTDALRQQNYLVTVARPLAAEEALFPRRVENTLLVLVGSLLVFGIGRLIIAGVKDHVIQ